MKPCIGITGGWSRQDSKLKSWIEVLQSQALTGRVFEFELPDYKLLNGNEVRFCQQLSENIESAASDFVNMSKLFVLPYQNILMDENECLDKIAYFIKKVFKEKGRAEPLVLVVGSDFYIYKHVDFVDYAQYLLSEDEENRWRQSKELKEKSVLSVGIPFQLNMEMCQQAAEQPEQSAEIAKLQEYPKKVLFVLGGLQEIARVGPEAGLIGRDDGRSRRAVKAGDPCARSPVAGIVFALVRVGSRNDESGDSGFPHFFPQGIQSG